MKAAAIVVAYDSGAALTRCLDALRTDGVEVVVVNNGGGPEIEDAGRREGVRVIDAGGNDATGIETLDTCHGHPNDGFGYHYHALSPCVLSTTARTHATLVGWSLDGFGIYVEYNSKGQLLTNAGLDGCHGRKSVVPWHGKSQAVYHYDMTFEFPYTVGCFRATPTSFLGMTTGKQP